MRWVCFALLAFAPLPAAAQENDAEKLFKEMESKLRSAPSLHLEFDTDTTANGVKDSSSTGSFHLDDAGKKFRIRQESKTEKKQTRLAVSDGKFIASADGAGFAVRPNKLKDGAFKNALTLLARGSVGEFLNVGCFGDEPTELNPDKAARVSNFKLGPKQKIGKQDTQVVEYELRLLPVVGNNKEPIKAAVWLDTSTLLPLKQTAPT